MIYVIVGFKVSETKSVWYSKATSEAALAHQVIAAFQKGAEFVSIRRVL